ncbi:hypothetical protein RchiOBHm_Chr5g0009411 [Rosa chinensis]|uniref:Uncharacterized protein n=1 Tax=Rosa chinensis TaxID=74649 RepID=A0A2P6Q4B2_ROSCH|nr:uncharacterized protein LOC112203000 [Rosa chinensis]PRQ29028.1 hypothetical protein RchiOBHm_Chr5g0009411 [Rosa chinensis]
MAAALVLCGNKRSFFEEDVFPSSLHRSKRLRCSSSSVPPQHVNQLRRPAEEPEPDRFGKRAKLTNENLNNNLNGAEEWVELFVREMSSATSVDDAKARTAKALEVFEQWISSRTAAEAEVAAAQKEEENMVLKQAMEEIQKENMILKRGVFIQNERLKEFEGRNQELEHVKQLVNQYKEKVSELEVANYGLELHLKQAQQCNNSIPLSFHPHVF